MLWTAADSHHNRCSWSSEGTTALFEFLPTGADVGVILGIKGEVGSLEGSVRASRLVDNRNVRRNATLLNKPFEQRPCTISAYSG